MKNTLTVTLLLLFLGTLVACEGDFRRPAQGSFSEVLVVMDSTQWNSATAEAIRETFASEIMTLPRPEQRYDLRFMTLRTNNDLDYAKRHKNAIFAASLDEETNVGSYIRATLSEDVLERVQTEQNFAFPLRDCWYSNQWTLLLTSLDDETLASKIRESGQDLVSNLDEILVTDSLTIFDQDTFRYSGEVTVPLSTTTFADYDFFVRADLPGGSISNKTQASVKVRGFSTGEPEIEYTDHPDTVQIPSSGAKEFFYKAKVMHPDGQENIQSVNLELFDNNEASIGQFSMYDDGTNGDITAGDSVYTKGFEIGPTNQPDNYTVKIFALDVFENSSDTITTRMAITQ